MRQERRSTAENFSPLFIGEGSATSAQMSTSSLGGHANRPLKDTDPDLDTGKRLFSLRRHEQCLSEQAKQRVMARGAAGQFCSALSSQGEKGPYRTASIQSKLNACIVKQKLPQTKILIIRPHDPQQIVPRSLKAGAHGSVDKARFGSNLVPAIRELKNTLPLSTSRMTGV